jgi:hypothetical protein
MLELIKSFVVRGDAGGLSRAPVCGLLWISNGNSSINGSFRHLRHLPVPAAAAGGISVSQRTPNTTRQLFEEKAQPLGFDFEANPFESGFSLHEEYHADPRHPESGPGSGTTIFLKCRKRVMHARVKRPRSGSIGLSLSRTLEGATAELAARPIQLSRSNIYFLIAYCKCDGFSCSVVLLVWKGDFERHGTGTLGC